MENKSIKEWVSPINKRIAEEYSGDSPLKNTDYNHEFTSSHPYHGKDGSFTRCHFWIDPVMR